MNLPDRDALNILANLVDAYTFDPRDALTFEGAERIIREAREVAGVSGGVNDLIVHAEFFMADRDPGIWRQVYQVGDVACQTLAKVPA